MLTITHTEADGTMIEGTAKSDGSAATLKAHGWRWSRNLGSWYLPRTRDVAPKTGAINATAAALRDSGFTVTVTIDAGVRDIATVEANRASRQADRVDALHAKTDRRRDQLEAAEARDRAAHNALPPMGEPVKIGHHSEGRHRNAIERAHQATHAAIDARKAVTVAEHRTAAATTTTAHRNNPAVIARRIERFRADRRAAQRELDGYSRTCGRPATAATSRPTPPPSAAAACNSKTASSASTHRSATGRRSAPTRTPTAPSSTAAPMSPPATS